MKKIIALIITVLLLVSCFGLQAAASEFKPSGDFDIEVQEFCELPKDEKITFSEDFKKLYVGETAYTRFNSQETYIRTSYDVANKIEADNTEIDNLELSANQKGTVFDAYIHYKDGAELNCSYMMDKCFEEYKNLMNGKASDVYIDFSFEEENILKVDIEKLKGEKVELKVEDFFYYETYTVYGKTSDESITAGVGEIYYDSEEIFYSEYKDNGDKYGDDGEIWTLYKVEDPQLIWDIDAKRDEFYSEMDYGVFFNEEIGKAVATVVTVIFFVVLPFAVMVGAVILAIRSKKKLYRKMFIITAALAGAQAIIFAIGSYVLFK